jgi:hypothetical protein
MGLLRAAAGSRAPVEGPDGDDRDDRETDAPPERALEGAVRDQWLEANGDDRSPEEGRPGERCGRSW